MEGGTTPPLSLVERASRQERVVVLAGLLLVVAAGLFATVWSGKVLMMMDAGGFAYGLLLFVMWWAMMMAMMLPSAAPAILTYASIRRGMADKSGPQSPLAVFVSGYVAIWTLFSAAAVVLQLATHGTIALTGMFALTSNLLGGVLLLAAGAYQFTPFKSACLHHCQSPFMYFARNWKNTASGVFGLGLRHGFYCLGCCWVLMLLLFYGGVMELSWIIGLALFVTAEKLLPAIGPLRHLSGAGLILWGVYVIVAALA
jgi:predicted metal-binding membrane protein